MSKMWVGLTFSAKNNEEIIMTKDLYILTIWQGVEPILTGPYKDTQSREMALQSVRKEYGPESSCFPVDITAGAQFEIGVFK